MRILNDFLDAEPGRVFDTLLLDKHIRLSRHIAVMVFLLALLLDDDRVRAGVSIVRTMALDLEGVLHVTVFLVKLTHENIGLRLPRLGVHVPLGLELSQDLFD